MSGARHFSEAEDAVIIREILAGAAYAAISRILTDRDDKAVQRRAIILRRGGRLPGLSRDALESDQPITWTPAIELNNDDKLVNRCLAEGGFPRAVVTSYGTVWGDPDGRIWRHTPPARFRRAA